MIALNLKRIIKNAYLIAANKRTISQVNNYLKYRSYMKGKICETVNYQPLHINFMPSYECTLNCKMCLTHSPIIPDNPFKYKGAKKMTFELFKEAIDKFHYALTCLFIGNGEPLLNQDLFKMIEYASVKRKMHTTLCTNGTLINKFLYEIINSPLNHISISLNSYNPEQYHKITGLSQDTFHLITNNISQLISLKNIKKKTLQLTISLIYDKQTIKYLQEMLNFANNLKADNICLYNIIPYPFIEEEARKQAIFIDDYEEIKILESIKLPNNCSNLSITSLLDARANYHICRDAFYSIGIDGDGNVSGCDRLLLNISHNGKFWDKDVFNNEHFKRLRNMLINSNSKLLPPCTLCYNNTPWKVLIENNTIKVIKPNT
jgi:MoaA/NifB/PqqE/SkfB family radical SAM enzyme